MLMNNWQFYLSNWQCVGSMWVISISFFTMNYLSAHSYSHRLNLTYYLKSSLLLAFCFSLFVWLIKLKCVPQPSHHYNFSGNHL